MVCFDEISWRETLSIMGKPYYERGTLKTGESGAQDDGE